jgi:hypothetical protein
MQQRLNHTLNWKNPDSLATRSTKTQMNHDTHQHMWSGQYERSDQALYGYGAFFSLAVPPKMLPREGR